MEPLKPPKTLSVYMLLKRNGLALSTAVTSGSGIMMGSGFFTTLHEAEVHRTMEMLRISGTDNSEFFIYEEENFDIKSYKFDALIVDNKNPVAAAITATISSSGYVTSLNIVDPGSGYTSGTIAIKVSAPKKVGVGIGTVASGIANISNGKIVGPITIVNPGFGYTMPPQVIAPFPDVESNSVSFERISEFTPIAQGFSGIVTGITTTSGIGGHPLAIKFYLRRSFIF